MEQFEVDFFRFNNGESPVEEYLNGTEIKMRAKIFWTIALLERNGNMLTMHIPSIWTTEYLNCAPSSAVIFQECYIFSVSVEK